MADDFGLEREALIVSAGVRQVFTPHKPIDSKELFFGRKAEVAKLIEQINTPGQHALLYGDRGVGKSSLANIVAELLKGLVGGTSFVQRCDSETTFASLLLPVIGKSRGEAETITTLKQTMSASVKIPIAGGGLASERETSQVQKHDEAYITPAAVAAQLAKTKGLLVIDETDAIRSSEEKKKLAELIKLLSDHNSPFKILVVGIARTGHDLTGGHASVERCLKETKLDRMKQGELLEIVNQGAAKLALRFDDQVTQTIVQVSRGYPHFTHLLALKCAEDAVAESRNVISLEHLARARARASEDAEITLKKSFDNATRSYKTDMFKTILKAATSIDEAEFKAEELRRAIERIYGSDFTQYSLNNYLGRLVSESERTVLRRLTKGVYAFNDPRMPSYIRIALGCEKSPQPPSDKPS